jgi:hypothetical protein
MLREADTQIKQLWTELGLVIRCTEVHYDADLEGRNLVFEIEHPDKSFALLAPPNVYTSNMRGLICSFYCYWTPPSRHGNKSHHHDFRPNTFRRRGINIPMQMEQDASSTLPEGGSFIPPKLCSSQASCDEAAENATRKYRRAIVNLVVAALHKIIGTRRRFPDTRVKSPESPILLDLAPCVWNANYTKVS